MTEDYKKMILIISQLLSSRKNRNNNSHNNNNNNREIKKKLKKIIKIKMIMSNKAGTKINVPFVLANMKMEIKLRF